MWTSSRSSRCSHATDANRQAGKGRALVAPQGPHLLAALVARARRAAAPPGRGAGGGRGCARRRRHRRRHRRRAAQRHLELRHTRCALVQPAGPRHALAALLPATGAGPGLARGGGCGGAALRRGHHLGSRPHGVLPDGWRQAQEAAVHGLGIHGQPPLDQLHATRVAEQALGAPLQGGGEGRRRRWARMAGLLADYTLAAAHGSDSPNLGLPLAAAGGFGPQTVAWSLTWVVEVVPHSMQTRPSVLLSCLAGRRPAAGDSGPSAGLRGERPDCRGELPACLALAVCCTKDSSRDKTLSSA